MSVKIEKITPIDGNPYYMVRSQNEPIRCFSFKSECCDPNDTWHESKALEDAVLLAKKLRGGAVEKVEEIEF